MAEFMFQNVVYRATVYRTGLTGIYKQSVWTLFSFKSNQIFFTNKTVFALRLPPKFLESAKAEVIS